MKSHVRLLNRARVLLLFGNVESGDKAIAEIKKAVSHQADVHSVECDLDNLKNVRKTGDKICEREECLDIIRLNIQVYHSPCLDDCRGCRARTPLRGQSSWSLFAHQSLASLDEEDIEARQCSFPPDRLHLVRATSHGCPRSNSPPRRSKNLTVVSPCKHSAKYTPLERALEASGDHIWAVATHPGTVHAGQQDQFKGLGSLVGSLVKAVTIPFTHNPEQGSVSTLWAATADDVEKNGWQGYYFTDLGQVGKETAQACSAQLGKNLHGLSEALIMDKPGTVLTEGYKHLMYSPQAMFIHHSHLYQYIPICEGIGAVQMWWLKEVWLDEVTRRDCNTS